MRAKFWAGRKNRSTELRIQKYRKNRRATARRMLLF